MNFPWFLLEEAYTEHNVRSGHSELQKRFYHSSVCLFVHLLWFFIQSNYNGWMHRVFIDFASSILNFFRSSFTYLVWRMYMPSSVCLIWSPRKNFNSLIILISNSACISLEKSLHKESLVALNMISSTYIWMIRNWLP